MSNFHLKHEKSILGVITITVTCFKKNTTENVFQDVLFRLEML